MIADHRQNVFLHENGLLHHNIEDGQGYSALIVVNTPALDDSGVSHGVEHLVFRRSVAFNQAESLFQLTSLTDLRINASTHCNVTYYHCHSQNQQSCLLGLSYLLNGLLTPTFTEQDLRQETAYNKYYGVINRELTPQQTDEQLNQQGTANRSDTSTQRCYQYGGDIELISQLTLTDVACYHAEYYQANNMSLVSNHIEAKEVASILDAIEDQREEKKSYCPKPIAQTHEYEPDKQLIRWWITSDLFNYFSLQYEQLSQLIEDVNAQLLPPQYNLNNQQQFPLDIIASVECSETFLSHCLTCFVLNNPDKKNSRDIHAQGNNGLYKNKLNKFSSNIFSLFNYYQILIAAATPKEKPKTIANTATLTANIFSRSKVHKLQKQAPAIRQKTAKAIALLAVNNCLCSQLAGHVIDDENEVKTQYKHRPLARLFTPLLKKAQQQQQQDLAQVFDQSHCLIVININKAEQYLAIITSFIIGAYPTFLAPRTQGHCYATAAQYVAQSQQLILFSAFDVEPSLRLTTIKAALVNLSNDHSFICASLPLAKHKIASTVVEDNNDLNDISNISTKDITEFILNRSCL